MKKEYILHLIGEISKYILDGNPSRMVISLHKEEDGLHLSIMDNKPRTDGELITLEASLNPEKRPEFSDYYGTMAGHNLLGSANLNLIGWQIKHADVQRTDAGVKIDLWLGSDRFDASYFNIPGQKKGHEEF